MTGDRWRRVEEVFEAALARPADARSALLDEACGDDSELRAEVESLLEHDSRASPEFMRPPEPPDAEEALEAARAQVGRTVGKYTIKEVIAVGGMGAVYLAEQERPQRQVALKVMNLGLAGRSARRRFEYESEFLARLRHPHIAQVYEAGTAELGTEKGLSVQESMPYFAMEYIPEARTITEYAESEQLDTRRRLELFAQVCEAVHHGHQRGIIHRDLKPTNILVDSSGQAKIIDLGVARATDSDIALTALQTDVGQLIGTLQYMSPEQCAADPHDLDTRSDVYGLGVVLYELLCGQLPYDVMRTTIIEAARVIREEPPPKPSTIDRRLRGDVETMALKALEKDREKRYQSAADLGRDIRRYLNREPIEAKAPSIWTRALRWVARHPVITTAAACLGIGTIIIAATLVTVWLVKECPHEMWRSDDQREARLLTFGGRSIRTWQTQAPGKIDFVELVKRPPELGGGHVALVALPVQDGYPHRAVLCAYDVERDLEDPVWVGHVNTSDVLPQLRVERGSVGEEFGVRWCEVLDVFPQRAGREIAVYHGRGLYSQCVVRIYDLEGTVLYQIWYDGELRPCYWMSDARLLVFEGTNAMVHWDRRGNLLVGRRDPCVVFAVRPKLGVVGRDYLHTEPGGDEPSAEWYRRLWPENAADIGARIELLRPLPPHDPDRSVRCVVRIGDLVQGSVAWVIDEHGEEVPGTRVCNDDYKVNQTLPDGDVNKLPPWQEFKLGPLLPIVSKSEGPGESVKP